MKHFISISLIITILSVLIIPICAAEDIDITNLNYNELIALRDKVELALFGTFLKDGVTLPMGDYIGGVDIPVGSYIIISPVVENLKNTIITFASYKSETENDEYIDRENFKNQGETYKITVKEGMLLSFSRIGSQAGYIQLKSFSGLFSNP